MWNKCATPRGAASAAALFTVCLASLLGACGPGDPEVERATLWMDTVKKGDFLIQARGPGNLEDAEDGQMIAVARIPEAQSFELAEGLRATVDTRAEDGIVEGRVTEVADRVEQGTVGVTIELIGELPEGVRPGLSIESTIDIRTVGDVLYVGKPAFARKHTELGLFKIVDDGEAAVRVPVQFGDGAINVVEVVSGLEEGDEIILSDMSRFDAADRVLLR